MRPSTTIPYRRHESQRDSDANPKVARHELPWESVVWMCSTPTGLWPRSLPIGCNPVGVVFPACDFPSVARASYLFSVVATRTNGAQRLRRFRLAQTRDVAEFPEPRKVQTVKRPEGRAPAPLVVGPLNTYRASQPWADGLNPFGIGRQTTSNFPEGPAND